MGCTHTTKCKQTKWNHKTKGHLFSDCLASWHYSKIHVFPQICYIVVLFFKCLVSNCDFVFHIKPSQADMWSYQSCNKLWVSGNWKTRSPFPSISQSVESLCFIFFIPDTERKSSTEVMSSTASVRMRTCFSHWSLNTSMLSWATLLWGRAARVSAALITWRVRRVNSVIKYKNFKLLYVHRYKLF